MSLISADELAARLDDPAATQRLRVVDVRWYLNRPDDGRAAYESGRIRRRPGKTVLTVHP